jgi:hypothetical protein
VEQAGFDRPWPVASVIYCDKLKKGHEQLTNRGVLPGPIQDGCNTQLFVLRDGEGHVIEVCKEPRTSEGIVLRMRNIFSAWIMNRKKVLWQSE